jgi:hypothetical protein
MQIVPARVLKVSHEGERLMIVVIHLANASSHPITEVFWAAIRLAVSFMSTEGAADKTLWQRRRHQTRRFRSNLGGHIGQPGPEHYDFDPRKRQYR